MTGNEGSSIERLIVDPATAWAIDDGRALGLVALGDCPPDGYPQRLPPFPLIGMGDCSRPVPSALDSVIEAPVSAASLVAAVEAQPEAALAVTSLLRGIETLPASRALPLESLAYGCLQAGMPHRRWLAARARDPAAAPGRLLTRRAGDTLTLLIDRPHARNAIDRPLRDALASTLDAASLDPSLARVALRAVGPAFGIGGDLAEFGITLDPPAAHTIRARTLPAHAAARCADRLDVHVQGACIGASLEFAAFAGRFTAAPDAWFQLPELRMGLIPGAGGCVSVPRRVGRQRALLMILSGRRIAASTALDWGLIDAIVDEPPVDPGTGDFDLV